jgi:hypothetical protein
MRAIGTHFDPLAPQKPGQMLQERPPSESLLVQCRSFSPYLHRRIGQGMRARAGAAIRTKGSNLPERSRYKSCQNCALLTAERDSDALRRELCGHLARLDPSPKNLWGFGFRLWDSILVCDAVCYRCSG